MNLIVVIAKCVKANEELDKGYISEFNFKGYLKGKAISKIQVKHDRPFLEGEVYKIGLSYARFDKDVLKGIADSFSKVKEMETRTRTYRPYMNRRRAYARS